MKAFKKILIAMLALIGLLVLALGGALLYCTAKEYSPDEIEAVNVPNGSRTVAAGSELTIVSYNTGFASLGETSDFFMDGGEMVRMGSEQEVLANMEGIVCELVDIDADIYLLQEVDSDAKRTYSVDQTAYYSDMLGMPYAYALNYSAGFVPYPFNDMIGHVNSGIATYTNIGASEAYRMSLPVPFAWPVRLFNLKRCLLVTRIPVQGSDRELVVINLHIEAYDDGEGKAAQTEELFSLLEEEAAKGNYCIAGGDFNQTFPGAHYYEPIAEGVWMPGTMPEELPEGYAFAVDDSLPTSRLLDRPYVGNPDPQYYIIDGFIVSSNIEVMSVETLDTDFVYSDHAPIKLVIRLAD